MELQQRKRKLNLQQIADSFREDGSVQNFDHHKSQQLGDGNFLIENNKKDPFLKKKSVLQLTFLLLLILITAIIYLSFHSINSGSIEPTQNTQENTLQSREIYDLVLLNSSSALCLDGSPGAYYISRSGDPDNVYIYFQGGAWCGDANYQLTLQNCYQRSKSQFGSSKYFHPQLQFYQGVLSKKKQNYFRNWKKVKFLYCDGSGHQGSRRQPILYKDTQLYFRGYNITVEKLEDLQQKIGIFSKAKNIVVSGYSAGGLASFTWTDYVAQRAKTAKVHGFPGSGIFYDSLNFNTKEHNFRQWFISIMNITNVQIDHPVTGCVKEHPNERYKCMFAQHLYKHIKTPIFAVQSLYDSYSIPFILGIRCQDPLVKNCDEQKSKIVNQYRMNVSDLLKSIGDDKKNGVWGLDCVGHAYLHLERFYSKDFEVPQGSGNQISKSFQNWIENTTDSHVFIDSVQWPNNKPCNNEWY